MKIKSLVFLILFAGCSYDNCNIKTNESFKQITVQNLIKDIYSVNNLSSFNSFLLENKNVLYPFYEVEDTSFLLDKVANAFTLIDNVYFDSLYNDVNTHFENPLNLFYPLDNSFTKFNQQSNYKLSPNITILISGFFNDVIVDKENIVIGLDYFLPKTNKYKPRDLPSYILDRYSPEHINSISLSSYLSQFNLINESDLTMINEMISFGKLYYVVSKLLPCTEQRIILGYSEKEFELVNKNEAFIYSFFLQNELLFEESNLIKQKYLSERPSTFEISQSVPGRIGRWLGWRIVSSFMDSSTYTLEELLKEDDYKNIFYNSNYNPI